MDIDEGIERIFRDSLSVEVPSPRTDIIASGLLDSLGLVTLLFELEQRFAIDIDTETLDLDAMRTVPGIAALVQSLAARPA